MTYTIVCESCKFKVAWEGTVLDWPPCPRCAWRPTQDVLEDKRLVERIEAMLEVHERAVAELQPVEGTELTPIELRISANLAAITGYALMKILIAKEIITGREWRQSQAEALQDLLKMYEGKLFMATGQKFQLREKDHESKT